jgi:hypothetical protein
MNTAGIDQPQPGGRTSFPGIVRLFTQHWIPLLIISVTSSTCLATDDSPSLSNTNAPAASSFVELRDGRLSVSATSISIEVLMQQVGAAANFDVLAYGDLSDQSGSWSFSNLPLGEAIRKLLRDINTIITYLPVSPEDAERRISRIYLLGSNSANVSPIRVQTVEPGLDNQLRLVQAQASDSQSRLAAIDRSEGLTDEITLENLAFALRHDPDPEVRIRAVTALEGIGGAAAVTALEAGLGDSDPAVRKKVIQAFGKIDDERIPLWLGQVLMGDPQPEVRLEAVQAIARKAGDIARIFLQAATDDSSKDVSEAALGLLR